MLAPFPDEPRRPFLMIEPPESGWKRLVRYIRHLHRFWSRRGRE